MDKPVSCLSNTFPGDKSGKRKKFMAAGGWLLLAGLLLGFRKGGLRHRQHGAHGRFQSLKGGLRCRHGQHNTTSMLGGLQ